MARPQTSWQTGLLHSIAALAVAFFGAVLLAPVASAQTISIQAYVNETTVGVDETVTYSIEVSGTSLTDVQTPPPPSAEALTLRQSMPRRTSRATYRNGQMQQSVTFQWTYRPQRAGTARIGATQVRVRGRTHSTDPIPLQITSRSGAPSRSGRAAQNKTAEDALFIRAEADRQHIFQGEQTTITYRLYYRPDYRVRRSRMAGSWDAEGFWREDLEVNSRPVPNTTTVEGKRYKSIILKRSAVFPTRAGSLHVDPLRIETEVQAPKRSRNLFDRFFSVDGDFEELELTSPTVPIRVRPLPGGAPDAFHGAVGSFQMQADVDRRAVEAGESVEVSVRLSGSGNLSTLTPPSVDEPDAFDIYDPDVSTQFDRTSERLRGSKTYTYVLVPNEAGTFDLPTVRFSYFDPEERNYKTLREDLPTVRVKGVPTPETTDSEEASMPAHDIAGIMTQTDLLRSRTNRRVPLHRSPWTYAALGLPLFALLGVLAYRRRRDHLASNPSYARRRKARPAARQHLSEAERLLENGDQRPFFAALQRALLGFVGHRLDLPERGLTRDQLDHHLTDADVPGRLRQRLRRLLANTDQARFAPAATDRTARRAALKRTRSLIDELDTALS